MGHNGGKQKKRGTVAEEHPELIKHWGPHNTKSPYEVSCGSTYLAEWICDKGHITWTKVGLKIRFNIKCAICSNKKVVPGVNDIATTNPEIAAMLVDSSMATKVTVGSKKILEWECKNGHKLTKSVDSFVKHGCVYCAGQKAVPGVNDIKTEHPELMPDWNDERDPSTVMSGSGIEISWKCPHGHEYGMAPYDRTHSGMNCPYCSGHRVLIGYNDLETTNPEIAAQIDPYWSVETGINGRTITAGSDIPIKFKCDKNPDHKWFASPYNRCHRGTGCPECLIGRQSSAEEDEMAVFVESLLPDGMHVIRGISISKASNGKNKSNKQLDVFIPELMLAFEFNGMRFHKFNETRNSDDTGVPADYHYRKWLDAHESGIDLRFIWEDDWIADNERMLNAIRHVINIHLGIDKPNTDMDSDVLIVHNGSMFEDVPDDYEPVAYNQQDEYMVNDAYIDFTRDWTYYDAGSTEYLR